MPRVSARSLPLAAAVLCLVAAPIGIAVALLRRPARWDLVLRGIVLALMGIGLLKPKAAAPPSGEPEDRQG